MEESTRSSSYETGKELEYEDASPESSFELAFESGSSTGNKSCANRTIFLSSIDEHNIGVTFKGVFTFLI